MQMPFSFFRKSSTSFYGIESDAAPHSYPHPHADLKLNAGLRKDIILTSTLTSVFRLLSIDFEDTSIHLSIPFESIPKPSKANHQHRHHGQSWYVTHDPVTPHQMFLDANGWKHCRHEHV
jgi:hypothetical protein